ncbi:hypothetical protein OE88DRAFT_226054 [Heliocybe sulcata]|uniref:BRCT domain-containing protein n=1 Tax=Heliocybe sulcata TaxID=5364 RepID=A0A5C3N0Y7_9AGAM|nr:hypothetical protein OE88DRAFT_226054 [Heliocybe sulcata]
MMAYTSASQSSSSDLMDGFASSLASPRLTQAVVELPAKQFERQLSADRLSHASNSQSSSSDLKDGHVSSFAPLSQQESAVDLPVQQPESQPSASIATFDELSHASNSESSSSDLKDDHVSSLSRQESDIEFPVQQPETQQSAFTSSSDAPSHVSRDHAPLPAPAPSRLPRLSLASSAAPPVIPPASSTTPATVTSPGSGAQPSKKPTSKTSVAGGARTRLKERAAKDAVLGGGRVTRSVALRMKAGKSVTAPKAAENQPKEPATPGLTRRKSFSFAVPTASSLSKAKPATQPTTPGKSKSQSRPTTPSRVPVPTTSTSRTPSRPSGSTSIPRRAATVAPLEQKSSLSSLSMALQKLNLPPPSRPSTSLGFNDGDDDLPAEDRRMKLETQDDIELGVSPRKRRSSTVAPTASLSVTGGKGPALASEARRAEITLSKGPGIPKPSASISARLPVAGPSAGSAPKKSTLDAWVVKARAANGLGRTAPGKIFGSGVGGAGRPGMWQRPKASRAPALEVVEGSPVKGVGAAEPDEQLVCEPPVAALNFSARNEDVSMEPIIPKVDEDQATPVLDKGKGKEKEQSAPEPVRDIRPSFKRDASRRASMASQALSESLSSVPPLHTPSGPGLMGPPAVPPFRSGGYKRAATLEPSASTPSTEEGSVMTTARGRPMRAAALQARSAPGLMRRATKTTATHVSAGRKGRAESVPPDNGLGVLKDCTIFVDVRTDDGDDAGGLFVEMLTGLGAKILSRVGQSCTHIVFKNGLMSTVTRYRLLNDPKPHVVGIAWVVECVEQRAKAEESKFGVDMEDAGIAGAAKRRRPSMLPKHMPISMHGISQTDSSPTTEPAAEGSDAGDQSIDGSSSCTSCMPHYLFAMSTDKHNT